MKKTCALALSAVLLLTSCSHSEQPTQETPEPTTLTVLCGQSTSDFGLEEILEEKLREYNVELQWESVDWGNDFASAFRARYISGEMPDLIIGKAQDVAGLQSFSCIKPFSDRFAQLFQPDCVTGVTIDGMLYGLPLNKQYQGVFYNKNLFWRYGLQVPQTLDELDRLVEQLEEIGITPFATHFQEVWYTGNVMMQLATNDVFVKDGQWGEEFRKGNRSFAASQEMQNCIWQMQYIYEHSWPDAMLLSQLDADDRFAQDEAAMYITGTWSLQALQSIRPDMSIGIFPYPNQEGNAKLLVETNLTFMKSADSPYEELLDDILFDIFQDLSFAENFYDFSQSYSTLNSVENQEPKLLAGELDQYIETGSIQNVEIGNQQLAWNFQYDFAKQMLMWLQGSLRFDALLEYADENRMYSDAMLY